MNGLEKEAIDTMARFIGIVKLDMGIKVRPSKDVSVFFTDAIRTISGVNPNSIRAAHSIPKASNFPSDIICAIRGLIDNCPITEEKIKRAVLEMPNKQAAVDRQLSEWQGKTATGISRFMSLSRAAMKYGSDRLSGDGVIAEIQNDYVNRVNVSKFSSKSFYRSREWKELRLAVLSVSNKCALCGATKESGAILHVDHIKPRSLWPELSLSIENMQLLCSTCNMAKSNIISEKYS